MNAEVRRVIVLERVPEQQDAGKIIRMHHKSIVDGSLNAVEARVEEGKQVYQVPREAGEIVRVSVFSEDKSD